LKNTTVAVSVGAGFLAGIAMFGAISFIPLFAQGSLGMTATEAGSLLTPLMLSWVSMSVVGGRLLLRVGYRSITLVGFLILTVGFTLLAMFQRETPVIWLYLDLILIGAGLGLTMLTLLIAVQQAVDRTLLGTATSLNQFSRAIGGASGVAIMGAVLTAGLTNQLLRASETSTILTRQQAESFASNPNALIEPAAKATLSPETLYILQQALSNAIHPVFWVGAVVCLLAFVVTLLLPKQLHGDPRQHTTDPSNGEKMIMAEQTTINARNQPVAK
jgi:MFS family permease